MGAADIAAGIAADIEERLKSLGGADLAELRAAWPRDAPRRDSVVPAQLPVLRWLPAIARDARAWAPEIVAALCRSASELAWRQTYTSRETDSAFLDRYGYSELIGLSGPLASERLACGFLLLGPATHYPRHRHEAQELYVPLSGTAIWQQGDEVWREHAPGTPIRHSSGEPHAMRTTAEPLLALYVWRSANLAQKSSLDA